MNTLKLDIIQSKKMNDKIDYSNKKFQNKNLLEDNYYDSVNNLNDIDNINYENSFYDINNTNNDEFKNFLKDFTNLDYNNNNLKSNEDIFSIFYDNFFEIFKIILFFVILLLLFNIIFYKNSNYLIVIIIILILYVIKNL
tara:strand:- start:119 stop:538 length:420 start_codon:yes stop_codon:yes gene_type:complete